MPAPRTQHPNQQPDGKQYKMVPMTTPNDKSILGKDGKPIMTREYEFTRPDGTKVIIQDHSAGHNFNDGADATKPHFNVRPPEDTRKGKVEGTKGHYLMKKKNNLLNEYVV